jgi:hypothetical protein
VSCTKSFGQKYPIPLIKIKVRRPPISSKEMAKAPPDNQIKSVPDAKKRFKNFIAAA